MIKNILYNLQWIGNRLDLFIEQDVLQFSTYKEDESFDIFKIFLDKVSHTLNKDNSNSNVIIPIFDDILGKYIPTDNIIIIYMNRIESVAEKLNIDVNNLKQIVEIHEWAHAILHLGYEQNGKSFDTDLYINADKGQKPSPFHETLAQTITYLTIENNKSLMKCFELLNSKQPFPYKLWEKFEEVSWKMIHKILIEIKGKMIVADYSIFEEIIFEALSLQAILESGFSIDEIKRFPFLVSALILSEDPDLKNVSKLVSKNSFRSLSGKYKINFLNDLLGVNTSN